MRAIVKLITLPNLFCIKATFHRENKQEAENVVNCNKNVPKRGWQKHSVINNMGAS